MVHYIFKRIMEKLTIELLGALRSSANEEEAKGMRRYMREQFDFFGVKSAARREVTQEIFLKFEPVSSAELERRVRELWQQPFRELQYCASDYLFRYRSKLGARHIRLIRDLIITRSWWDTVDSLATRSVGDLVLRYAQVREAMDKWIRDPNLWIRRCALIHQLKFREYTDWDRLQKYCLICSSEEDFFIRKAIGWSLREYAKNNPIEVKRFVQSNDFSTLTVREALKNL